MKVALYSKLRSLREKVPTYRLFLKIFFWFWATVLGLLVIVWTGFFFFSGFKEISSPNMYATVAPALAREAIQAYESGGPKEFARFTKSTSDGLEKHLYLLDESYRDVLSRPLTDEALDTARAAKTGRLIVFRGHISAYKAISPAGRPYILLVNVDYGLGELRYFLFGHSIRCGLLMIVVAGLLSLGLAYHIAAPIHSIQSTARKVATGDLHARVPAKVSRRHDELAALAIDFDSMVSRLETLISTQKDLLNSVSHEVRSPLARINLCLALLRKDSSASSADVLGRLESDVSRIDLLMGQLLMLSRFEAGLSSAEREEIDLTQILEEVTADGNFEAQPYGKSVTLQTADVIRLESADPLALRSAFENIIRNAIRFTAPATDVQVKLAVDRSGSKPVALLTVADHGPGVPEKSLEAIFQPFVQIANDEIEEKGNGLGLAIASEAVRMHGGTIYATNLQRGGLEVTIRLPALRTASASIPESALPACSRLTSNVVR